MNIEYTDKSVSALPCSYAQLVTYGGNFAPGNTYESAPVGATLPPGTKPAKIDGNLMIDSNGMQVLVNQQGQIINTPITRQSTCGAYNSVNLAYGV